MGGLVTISTHTFDISLLKNYLMSFLFFFCIFPSDRVIGFLVEDYHETYGLGFSFPGRTCMLGCKILYYKCKKLASFDA
jgi:hypothetical protein